MKKLLFATAFLLAGFTVPQAKAQVNVNVNIGTQPIWGPTGYDHVDFYYLPDINCYYDVVRGQFVYLNGNSWIYARTLPPRYKKYNLYSGYKVVINEADPFRNNRMHMSMYARYKGVHNQPVIRDSRDNRYYANQNHPRHNEWKNPQQNGNNGNGRVNEHRGNNGRGNDHGRR